MSKEFTEVIVPRRDWAWTLDEVSIESCFNGAEY